MYDLHQSRELLNSLDPRAFFEQWFSLPFNGQARRLYNVMHLSSLLRPKWAIETGTFYGSSTYLFLGIPSMQKVFTIESNAFYLDIAKHRYADPRYLSKIEFVHGDSDKVLSNLLTHNIPGNDPVILYLDAHWYEYLPTSKEVAVLQTRGGEWVAIVDDFKVPGLYSEGYGYDKYGDKEISLEMFENVNGFRIFIPGEHSIHETGWSRGTAYLISNPAINRIGESFIDHLKLVQVM